jgi:TPR repeat protein
MFPKMTQKHYIFNSLALSQAVFWYTEAAEEDDMNAQYDLGVCYEKGQGVEKDLNAAQE